LLQDAANAARREGSAGASTSAPALGGSKLARLIQARDRVILKARPGGSRSLAVDYTVAQYTYDSLAMKGSGVTDKCTEEHLAWFHHRGFLAATSGEQPPLPTNLRQAKAVIGCPDAADYGVHVCPRGCCRPFPPLPRRDWRAHAADTCGQPMHPSVINATHAVPCSARRFKETATGGLAPAAEVIYFGVKEAIQAALLTEQSYIRNRGVRLGEEAQPFWKSDAGKKLNAYSRRRLLHPTDGIRRGILTFELGFDAAQSFKNKDHSSMVVTLRRVGPTTKGGGTGSRGGASAR